MVYKFSIAIALGKYECWYLGCNKFNHLLITATNSKGFHAHTVVAVISNPAVTDTKDLTLIFTAPCASIHSDHCMINIDVAFLKQSDDTCTVQYK